MKRFNVFVNKQCDELLILTDEVNIETIPQELHCKKMNRIKKPDVLRDIRLINTHLKR